MGKAIPMKEVKCPRPGLVFEVGGTEYTIKGIYMGESNRGCLWCEGTLPGCPDRKEFTVFDYALEPYFDVFSRHSWFDEPRAFQDFKCRTLL